MTLEEMTTTLQRMVEIHKRTPRPGWGIEAGRTCDGDDEVMDRTQETDRTTT